MSFLHTRFTTTPWSQLAWTKTLVRWSPDWTSSWLKPWRNTDTHAGVQPDRLVLPLLEPCIDAQSGRPLVPPRSWSHTKHKQTLFIWRLENICAGVNLLFRWKLCFTADKTDLTVQPMIVWLENKKTNNPAVCDCAPEFTWKDVREISIARWKIWIYQWNIVFLYLFCSKIIHVSVQWFNNSFSMCTLRLEWWKY